MSGSSAPPDLTVFSNGVGVANDQQLNSFVQGGGVVADLRNFPALNNMIVATVGQITPGDGGQRFYYWNGSSVAADDGVNVVRPYGLLAGAWLTLGATFVSAAMAPVIAASTLDLARQAMGVNAAACVVMMPLQPRTVPAEWLVYKPDGTLLDVTGTTTNGLQEAINYTIEFGYDFIIYGGTTAPGNWPPPFDPVLHPGSSFAVLNYASPIVVPSIQCGYWRFGGVIFNYTGPAADVTWTWDSTEIFELASQGAQWVANTTNIIMSWFPTNQWPEDRFGPTTASTVWTMGGITQLNTSGAGGPCVRLDATNAPIQGNAFIFSELNGGFDGLELLGATHGCLNNTIKVVFLHNQTAIGLRVGMTTADASTVTGNIIEVIAAEPGGTVGIDVYGSGNIINGVASNASGSPMSAGLKLESTAANNQINMGRLEGTIPLQDLSTSRSNAVNFGSNFVSVNKAGSSQGITTGVITKVAFSNEVYDTDSTYDTGAFRWTPGIPGKARIDVSINWVTGGALGTILATFIYKNGGALLINQQQSVAIAGNQTVALSAQVSIDDAADYFEIFVSQNSGGNLNVDGANTNTWAMYERIR